MKLGRRVHLFKISPRVSAAASSVKTLASKR
jgi:hypothetical protein